jgi:hypothetical protein
MAAISFLVELLDKEVTTSPDAMLEHVHELAGGSEISRDITVTSPPSSCERGGPGQHRSRGHSAPAGRPSPWP